MIRRTIPKPDILDLKKQKKSSFQTTIRKLDLSNMFDNLNTGIQMVTVFGHLTIISLVGLMRVSEYWTSLVLEWYIKSWSKKQTVWYSDAFLFNLHLRLTT